MYTRGRSLERSPPFNYDLSEEALLECAAHNPNVARFLRENPPGANPLTDYFKGLPYGPRDQLDTGPRAGSGAI